jgi:hypothetical protein
MIGTQTLVGSATGPVGDLTPSNVILTAIFAGT